MKAVAYVSGDGMPQQLKRIAAYAGKNNLPIAKRFRDQSQDTESTWLEMLDYCRDQKIRAILVDSHERLSDRSSVALDMIGACHDAGAKVIDCTLQMTLTTDDPDRWFAVGTMLLVAEFHRRLAARDAEVAL